MPELRLVGDSLDGVRVLATMVHPEDEQLRDQLVSVYHCRRALQSTIEQGESVFSFPTEKMRRVLNSPSYDEVEKRTNDLQKGGCIAGDILASVYAMHLVGTKEPGIRKAIHALQKRPQQTSDGDSIKFPTSEPQIRHYWNQFYSVSPLWAAFRLAQIYPLPDVSDVLEFFAGSKLPELLGLAELIRQFGENFIPEHVKLQEPILSPSKMWRAPENYPVRKYKPDFAELPEWISSALKGYAKRYLDDC